MRLTKEKFPSDCEAKEVSFHLTLPSAHLPVIYDLTSECVRHQTRPFHYCIRDHGRVLWRNSEPPRLQQSIIFYNLRYYEDQGQRAHGEKPHVCNSNTENYMYKSKMPRNFLISLTLGASLLSTHSHFKASCHLPFSIYVYSRRKVDLMKTGNRKLNRRSWRCQ